MNPTNQSAARGASPILHITYRQRQQAGPTGTPPFSWYLCPQAGAFRHLVLLADHQPLGHWVLPATGLGLAEPTSGLWLQVTPDLAVARPVANEASCQGPAWAMGRAAPAATQPIGELVLQLPASPVGTGQVYWLRQLQPGGSSWLLSKKRPASCP